MNLDYVRAARRCVELLGEAVDLAVRHGQRGRGNAEWRSDDQSIALSTGLAWCRDVFGVIAATATPDGFRMCHAPLEGAQIVVEAGPRVPGIRERLNQVRAILLRVTTEPVRH